MTQIEFLKNIKKLCICYMRDMNEEQINEWYSYFKDINSNIFNKAIELIVKKNKYFPSVKDLIDECKNAKNEIVIEVINKMEKDNYFKNSKELEKIYAWINEGIIPGWLREDMKDYYIKQIEEGRNELTWTR